MVDGYHSLVFQHRAMRTCPVHATALRRDCQACGCSVAASFPAAASAPFACPICGSLLARGARAHAVTPLIIEQTIGASRVGLTLQLVPANGDPGSLALVPKRSDRATEAVLARRAARFASWHDHDPYVARGVGRRTRRLVLEHEEVSDAQLCISQHIAYLAWLERLEQASPADYAESTQVLQRLQWNRTDPAFSRPMSVVAAAWARLRLLYGGIPEEQTGGRLRFIEAHHMPRIQVINPVPFAQRGIVCAISTAGNRALLQCELEALAAWLVLNTRIGARVLTAVDALTQGARARVASQLPWSTEPDPTQIAPAWRVTRVAAQAELQFRPAVEVGTLGWLIKRSANHFVRPG
jgi:predicted RNA-binding Zn-ribbon protein involved in translation (DUF1610 family)